MLDISQLGPLNRAPLLATFDGIIRGDARQHGCERQGVASERRAQ